MMRDKLHASRRLSTWSSVSAISLDRERAKGFPAPLTMETFTTKETECLAGANKVMKPQEATVTIHYHQRCLCRGRPTLWS